MHKEELKTTEEKEEQKENLKKEMKEFVRKIRKNKILE